MSEYRPILNIVCREMNEVRYAGPFFQVAASGIQIIDSSAYQNDFRLYIPEFVFKLPNRSHQYRKVNDLSEPIIKFLFPSKYGDYEYRVSKKWCSITYILGGVAYALTYWPDEHRIECHSEDAPTMDVQLGKFDYEYQSYVVLFESIVKAHKGLI